jgi:Ribbon-helix-helix protein, copG family
MEPDDRTRLTDILESSPEAVFLTDDLDRLLQETARRTRRPQAEIVREALTQYLGTQPRPWPRSVGMGADADSAVTLDNVKDWVRDRWRHGAEQAGKADAAPPTC